MYRKCIILLMNVFLINCGDLNEELGNKPDASSYISVNNLAESGVKTEHIKNETPTGSYLPPHIKENSDKPSEGSHFTPTGSYLPPHLSASSGSSHLQLTGHYLPSQHTVQIPVATYIPSAIPHVTPQHEYYGHPKYDFKYGVEDHNTGDIKSHHEERDGDVVKGEYSLLQPDGVTRNVHYTADQHGFNADVSYTGHSTHPEVQKVLAAPYVY